MEYYIVHFIYSRLSPPQNHRESGGQAFFTRAGTALFSIS